MNVGRGEGVHFALFGGERINFRLRRTSRRTLAITVQPDLGVLVTAPATPVWPVKLTESGAGRNGVEPWLGAFSLTIGLT